MIQDEMLSAENGCSLFKDSNAVLDHLASSLRARRALRTTSSRLAESVNITLKEY
jgi:predicted TIM-barrel fold metal-dependent hydrolase